MLFSNVPNPPGAMWRWLKFFAAALSLLTILTPPVFAIGNPLLDDELSQALKLESNLDNGKQLFEMCESCHMAHAWGSEDGVHPQLAGQHRSVIIKQFSDFRAGDRDNPEMQPFAEEDVLGPQGMADVAGYIASMPMNPSPGKGPGTNLELGGRVYEESCSVCHDDRGEGFDAFFFPKIKGQHYRYLLRQLNWMLEGRRQNVYRGMLRRISEMTPEELDAVSDYLSRIPPEENEEDEEYDQ